MDEADFEGTFVLEELAAIGKVEDFFDAIDADDVGRHSADEESEGRRVSDRDRRPEDAGERWRALSSFSPLRPGVAADGKNRIRSPTTPCCGLAVRPASRWVIRRARSRSLASVVQAQCPSLRR